MLNYVIMFDFLIRHKRFISVSHRRNPRITHKRNAIHFAKSLTAGENNDLSIIRHCGKYCFLKKEAWQ